VTTGQRGSIGVAVLLAALLVGGAGATLLGAATDLGSSAIRARTAAEAAALAAAGVSPLAGGAGDPRQAAAAAAAANGAELVACCAGGAPLETEATARVEPKHRLVRLMHPQVRATARAGLRPPPDPPGLGIGSGRLLQPVAGPVTSGFGWRTHPISGDRRFHPGIDIAAPTGTPVRAADGGTVISAGWQGGYGLTVVIDHGGGITTLYAHLSRLDTRVGVVVRAGEQIGAVGSTGRSTGPHLHFEVRERGIPRDPAGYR
jgi:murein DD-endopeptidase MepM/ murein hydrolase activator NlpD